MTSPLDKCAADSCDILTRLCTDMICMLEHTIVHCATKPNQASRCRLARSSGAQMQSAHRSLLCLARLLNVLTHLVPPSPFKCKHKMALTFTANTAPRIQQLSCSLHTRCAVYHAVRAIRYSQNGLRDARPPPPLRSSVIVDTSEFWCATACC